MRHHTPRHINLHTFKHRFSFWEKDSFLKSYDLIVIGAGIVGLSSALFYKQSNVQARVLVLDKGFMPEGASSRNAGFACIGSVTEHLQDLQKESEQNIKNRIIQRYAGLKLLRQTLGDETIGYKHCGGYELFTSDKKFEQAIAGIKRLNKWMHDLLNENEVYKTTHFEGYSAIYNRVEGALHPGKMMQALIKKVLQADIEIKWNTLVRELAEKTVVLENRVELQAAQILIATNGFTTGLMPEIKIKPARGLVLVTQEWENMPWKGTFHYDSGYVYFRNIGNRLLIGGFRNMALDEEGTDQFGINETVKIKLLQFSKDILKLPKSCIIEYEWSGIMGFTDTKTPIVKRLDKHKVVAAGLSGMGIAIGMKVAENAVSILQ